MSGAVLSAPATYAGRRDADRAGRIFQLPRSRVTLFRSMEQTPDLTQTSNEVPLAAPAADAVETPVVPAEPAVPITSRFLYVDVAALRAKQLRRGARLRYEMDAGLPAPKKPERMAMEEVRRCLVHYTIPPWRGARPQEQ